MELFTRYIVHICFGEDISDTLMVEMYMWQKQGEFQHKSVTLPEAIYEHDNAIFDQAITKWCNPLYMMARKITGIKNFTKH